MPGMDVKTIQDRSKALQKATEDNESPAILKILRELKDGVVASESLLRSTKIGVVVNKAKASKDPQVTRLAGDIVRKWKEEVGGGAHRKIGAGSGRASPSPSGSRKGPTSGTASPAPAPANEVAPENRTWKTDRMDTSKTDKSVRNNCIGLMYDGLAYMSTTPAARVLNVATAVEAAAHVKLGPETRIEYKSKMRSLYQNLKQKNSGPLRESVLEGRIAPERFVMLTHEELKSKELRAEEKELDRENMRAAQAPVEEKAVSSSLMCGKCGQKRVSYTQAQTRSADEPMTTFCECMACGRRWKFS